VDYLCIHVDSDDIRADPCITNLDHRVTTKSLQDETTFMTGLLQNDITECVCQNQILTSIISASDDTGIGWYPI